MAVRADDLAFGHLVENLLPVPTCELVRDLKSLVPEMVKLEHERISLAAVSTRMSPEVLEQVSGSSLGAGTLAPGFPLDVLLAMG